MHRVAGVHGVDDLERVAVDDRHLAGIAQRDREEVLPIALVLRRRGPLLRRQEHLPGLLHLRQRHLRRRGRLVLQELRHHLGLGLGQHALFAPVGHAAGRAVEDDRGQRGGALRPRLVRGQRRAGGAFAQRAVAARAALEEDLLGVGELGLGERRARPRRSWSSTTLPAKSRPHCPAGQPGSCTTALNSWSLNAFASVAGISPFWQVAAGAALADVRIGLHDRFVDIAGDILGFAGIGLVLQGRLGRFAHLRQIGADGPGGVGDAGDDVAGAAAALLERGRYGLAVQRLALDGRRWGGLLARSKHEGQRDGQRPNRKTRFPQDASPPRVPPRAGKSSPGLGRLFSQARTGPRDHSTSETRCVLRQRSHNEVHADRFTGITADRGHDRSPLTLR